MGLVEIYYFSGTGNSLHIAKELQKRIVGVKIIPIISLLSKDIITANAQTVGFVFPLHGMTIPIPVKKFLQKIDLNQTEYTFAIATRAGTKCFAFSNINKILKQQGKSLGSYFVINMASNDPKFKIYDVPTNNEISEIELRIQTKLELIEKIIINKEIYREKDLEILHNSGFVLDQLVLLGMKFAEQEGAKDYFYSDLKCIGCGICEKVCLSEKIKIVDDRPDWQQGTNCYLCYACINYCLKQAVQIKSKWYMKSYTERNGRYPHPYATAAEISEQKDTDSNDQ